ncbi:MAG: hypothetical protein JEZ09_09830 [Salinivirgaceae bacterium]|nr:hypothetical protein [Salinivirgaceae bacterium]
MEKQFITKIRMIQDALKDKCILKATEFDELEEAKILQDATGAICNKFLHKHCADYAFEIWKKLNNNYYIKATAECRKEAVNQGLTPHTNGEYLRGKKRK